MNHLTKFQNALEQVSAFAPLLVGESKTDFQSNSEAFQKSLDESKFIKVPLVGIFSAGKSSLLNIFTGCPGMLPVDTMPETAVAYELYYGDSETVELYRNGEKMEEKPLAAIKELNTQPGDIAKVYCKSDNIKQLQERGIILVDMPGIGSGIERHDAAIFNYIHSGTAFVLLVDVEQGSLRGSTLTFMHELSQYNLHPAVLVSKTDKKPAEEVQKIVEYVRYQLTKLGNANPFVSTVCAADNNLGGMEQYLSALNPADLVSQKLKSQLSLVINGVIDQLNIRIDLRNKDIAGIEEKIQQLEQKIRDTKENFSVNDSGADTPLKSTQDILDNVRAALSAKVSDIAQMIVNKEDSETIKSTIISIVRSEMYKSFAEESDQYTLRISNSIQQSLEGLEGLEEGNMLDGLFENLPGLFDTFEEEISLFFERLAQNEGTPGTIGKIGLVIAPFLSSIASFLFGKSDSDVLNTVREKLTTTVIESLLNTLRPTISQMVTENQQKIQAKLKAEVITRMEAAKEALREKMADATKSKEEVAAEIAQLTSAVEQLQGIKNNL